MASVVISGDTSGSITLAAPTVSGSTTISFAALSGNNLVDIARSLTTDGYVQLSNGLILQWGVTGSIANVTAFTVTFPIAFPTACLFATNIPITLNAISQTAPLVTAVSTTTFSGRNSTGITNTFRWFALGN
jgi:hypothetical protein